MIMWTELNWITLTRKFLLCFALFYLFHSFVCFNSENSILKCHLAFGRWWTSVPNGDKNTREDENWWTCTTVLKIKSGDQFIVRIWKKLHCLPAWITWTDWHMLGFLCHCIQVARKHKCEFLISVISTGI